MAFEVFAKNNKPRQEKWRYDEGYVHLLKDGTLGIGSSFIEHIRKYPIETLNTWRRPTTIHCVTLHYDKEARRIGMKPVRERTQESVTEIWNSNYLGYIRIKSLLSHYNIEGRGWYKAEWNEEEEMLVIHLNQNGDNDAY